MKRNHTTQRLAKGGVPPYTKYRKTPYRYSEAHRQWQREMGARAAKEREGDRSEKF